MPMACIRINLHLLLVSGWRKGSIYRVVESLPDGTKIRHVYIDSLHRDTVCVIIEHESFDEAPDIGPLPTKYVQFAKWESELKWNPIESRN